MQVFIVCLYILYIYCPWRSVNRFNPYIFLYPSQARNGNVICCDPLCVRWVKMRCDYLFCWYWWNWWPSLFKLSYLNILIVVIQMYLCSYLYVKFLFYLHCPPATYLTPAQHHKIIVQWWYTCKNDIWLNFFLSTKNIC